MSSHVVFFFAISFLIWIGALTLSLVLLIRPKFIFKKGPPTPQQNLVIVTCCLVLLFMSSFILGVMTYLMKVLNSIILF